MESGAHAPLNESNLLLGGSGIQKGAFSDQRDTEIFMIPLLEGSEVSQLALESRACGPLEISTELLMPQECETQRHRFIRDQQGRNLIAAWVHLSGPDGNCADCIYMNTSSVILLYKYRHVYFCLHSRDLFNCKEP